MNYLANAIFNLFLGTLFGMLGGWNKKVLFAILTLGLILCVATGFILSVDNLTGTLKWYQLLFNVFFVTIGYFAGETIYKGIFKPKE